MSVTTTHTEQEITTGLMALIAWAGNATAASRALKNDGIDIPSSTLNNWAKFLYAPRYAEMREKYSEQMETELAHEFRDVARQAVEVQRVALDRALVLLKCNDDRDPGRTAANAARVAQSMTDKLLALTGRPSSIREDRSVDALVRSLMSKGVISLPEAAVTEAPQEESP